MKRKWPWPAGRWKEALEKYKYVLLVMAVGALLMVLPTGEGTQTREEGASSGLTDNFQLDEFEEKLGAALSQIEGAGRARVVLTLDSGSRQVLAQDQERDGDGGSASSTVTLGRGSGSQTVVPLQTLSPRFRGALVVCPGGGDPAVRLKLSQAVSALTGLGADRIAICAGNA